MRKMLLVLVAIATMAVTARSQALAGSGRGLPVANPDAVIHGMTYAQWEGAYQVWIEEIPFARIRWSILRVLATARSNPETSRSLERAGRTATCRPVRG